MSGKSRRGVLMIRGPGRWTASLEPSESQRTFTKQEVVPPDEIVHLFCQPIRPV